MMEAQKNRQLKNKIHIQPKKKVKFQTPKKRRKINR